MPELHTIDAAHAHKIASWLDTRGGIAIWNSVNLSNPGQSWTTPVNDDKGIANTAPNWQTDTKPARIITDIAEVQVATYREVKRFHVAVRQSSNGLSLKVTDGGSRRIKRELEKASECSRKAHYEFDYCDYNNCVILVEDSVLPLSEYLLIFPSVH